jgi:predicted N-acetyltransferase YhbS
MKIEKLYDNIEMAETVTKFVYGEFVSKSKSQLTFNDVLEYFKKTSNDKLPITYVAIENSECIGTVSLFANDLTTRMDLSPWLASLVVRHDYRNRGVGERLISHVLNEAKSLGYKKLYLKPENKGSYYGKKGWKHIGKGIDKHNQETGLYEYELQNRLHNRRLSPWRE